MEITYEKSKLIKLDGKKLVDDIYDASFVDNKIPCSLCQNSSETNKAPLIHFHGSSVGHCIKQLKHQAQQMLLMKFWRPNPDKMYFLKDGHLHEQSMLSSLEKAGYALDYKDVEIQKDYIADGETIKMIGHPDARIKIDGKYYIVECKAVKPYAFGKFKKGIIPLWYYGQCITYTQLLASEGAILLVKCRSSSEVLQFLIDRNTKFWDIQLEILATVQKAIKEHEEIAKPYQYEENECKFCPLQEECWS